jgi:curved DNA-binding protein CbpA
MLKNYIVLGVTLESTDEEIRNRYLELVRKHTPEKYPAQFQQITEAYEAIKTRRNRLESRLFYSQQDQDLDKTLRTLARSIPVTRRRATLTELIQEETGI